MAWKMQGVRVPSAPPKTFTTSGSIMICEGTSAKFERSENEDGAPQFHFPLYTFHFTLQSCSSPFDYTSVPDNVRAGAQGDIPFNTMKVTLLLGSTSDTDFAKKIEDTLKEFSVPSEIIVASAHKVPEKVIEIVEKLNKDPQPQVIITVVGMSNGLGGVAAGSCVHPVITCPPAKTLEEYQVDLNSSLRMPSDVPVMTVLHPKNAALAAVRILAEGNEALKKKVADRIEEIKAGY